MSDRSVLYQMTEPTLAAQARREPPTDKVLVGSCLNCFRHTTHRLRIFGLADDRWVCDDCRALMVRLGAGFEVVR